MWVLLGCYCTQAGQLCADEERCTLIHRNAQGEKPLTRSFTVLTFLLLQQQQYISYVLFQYSKQHTDLDPADYVSHGYMSGVYT